MLFAFMCLCYVHTSYMEAVEKESMGVKKAAVALVGSSDLSVNTAARYIRHVSLSDVSTPFQDCPACFDYFPGALSTSPPKYFGIETRFEQVIP